MTGAESRWAQVHGVTQFGIVPLIVTNKIVGCLYVDRTGAALPDRSALQFARDIGALVVRAIDSRRRSPTNSTSSPVWPNACFAARQAASNCVHDRTSSRPSM